MKNSKEIDIEKAYAQRESEKRAQEEAMWAKHEKKSK